MELWVATFRHREEDIKASIGYDRAAMAEYWAICQDQGVHGDEGRMNCCPLSTPRIKA
jgi:hypothetical protein